MPRLVTFYRPVVITRARATRRGNMRDKYARHVRVCVRAWYRFFLRLRVYGRRCSSRRHASGLRKHRSLKRRAPRRTADKTERREISTRDSPARGGKVVCSRYTRQSDYGAVVRQFRRAPAAAAAAAACPRDGVFRGVSGKVFAVSNRPVIPSTPVRINRS